MISAIFRTDQQVLHCPKSGGGRPGDCSWELELVMPPLKEVSCLMLDDWLVKSLLTYIFHVVHSHCDHVEAQYHLKESVVQTRSDICHHLAAACVFL